MSQFCQIADNLRNKYLELRALEKRSDEMLKQVIDTFYLMEGLNRLQADLDCLDVLLKNNTFLERVLKFKTSTEKKTNSRKNKLWNVLNRALKTITSSSLFKQLKNKESQSHTESAFDQLKRLTYTQHIKISELMKMVHGTIVSNYEVLEQLELISGIPTKDSESCSKLGFMASTGLSNGSESREIKEYLAAEEQINPHFMEEINVDSDIFEMCSSTSHDSTSTLCMKAESIHPSETCRQASTLYWHSNRTLRNARRECMGECNNSFSEIEAAIGDGQTAEHSGAKKNESISLKYKGHHIRSSSKSSQTLDVNNQFKGDFVNTKFEDGMEISNEILNKIPNS